MSGKLRTPLKDVRGLTTILRQGVGMMPAVGHNWSDADIQALVAYTKTLSTSGGKG